MILVASNVSVMSQAQCMEDVGHETTPGQRVIFNLCLKFPLASMVVGALTRLL